ncbi:hypothetical protein OOJ91_33830 [Micromonospora lupini]|uniref:hypothetical protein n=1 Tax=Micromonospora lupini TaxID=285679 RepID=UPI002250426D|nr:hypothetical protein [Micromonospora lupini]MCX5070828.1 hypothetical protein [Micromonospora lupini]
MATRVIDLDAARREPEPIPLILMRQEWTLPGELPADVLDPLFDGELDDLIALIVDLLGEEGGNGLKSDDVDLGALVKRISTNPQLVSATLRALRSAFEKLLGEEQWQRWIQARPGLGAYLLLAKTAFAEYGVSLGEALGWSSSSTAGGTTSKRTSPATPRASTRAASGSQRTTRA